MSKFFSWEFKITRVLKAVAAIVVLACILYTIPFSFIQKDFKEYHDKYLMFANAMCKSEQILHPWQFMIVYNDFKADGPLKTAGQTYRTNKVFNQRFIFIDEDLWKHGNENYRVTLIFHELTHAYFGYPDLREPWFQDHYMFWFTNEKIEPFTVYKQFIDLLHTDLCKQ